MAQNLSGNPFPQFGGWGSEAGWGPDWADPGRSWTGGRWGQGGEGFAGYGGEGFGRDFFAPRSYEDPRDFPRFMFKQKRTYR